MQARGCQIELSLYPVSYQNNGVIYVCDLDDGRVAPQLSFGVYFR